MTLTVNDLRMIVENTRPYFDEIVERGERNERMYASQHWSDDEKKEFENQDREPYSINIAPHKINIICAEQRKNRVGWRAEAVSDVNDEIKAELMTMRLRDIEIRNNLKALESDIFLSGMLCFGACKIYVEKENGMNMIKFKDVDYRNIIWDVNSREYERNDAAFVCEIKQMYRIDVELVYGKKISDTLTPTLDPKTRMQYWINPNPSGVKDLDIITIYEMYYKTVHRCWVVVVGGEKILETYNKDEAEEIAKLYLGNMLDMLKVNPEVDIVETHKIRYDKYEFNYNEILKHETTDLPFAPYSIYQSFAFKDKIWCMMDLLRDPQRFYDKIVAQIDYSFGTDLKNVYEVVTNNLDGITLEEAQDRIRNNMPIPVLMKGTFNQLSFTSANPQYMNMLAVMNRIIDDIGGGRSFSGLRDETGESGVAIQLKKMQGELLSALFIDNLFRWRRDLGKKTMWHIQQYDTAPTVIKLHGGSLGDEVVNLLMQQNVFVPSKINKGEGYLKLNHNPLTMLKDAQLELTVTEAEISESQRESRMAELITYSKIYQVPPPIELWLEVAPISYSLKQKIAEHYKAQQEAAQRLQEQQLNIEKAKILVQDKGQVIKPTAKEKE